MRRRAAIDELYTEDCVLYVPPGTFVGREALDKFARSRRQDRGALRVPQFHPFIAATALSMIARLIPTRAPPHDRYASHLLFWELQHLLKLQQPSPMNMGSQA